MALAENWWEAAPLASPAQAEGFTGFIPGTPKPPAPPNPLDVDKFENQRGNQQFDNTTNLRKEYTSSKDYLAYAGSMRALAATIQQPPTPQGDLAVIYNYAKTMDPDSAVREGELDLAQSGASMVEQMKKRYNMVTEGATLPPGVRDKLIEAMRGQARGYNVAYTGLYQRTAKMAEQQGIDPKLVVGDHIGEIYRPVEEAWVASKNGKPPEPEVIQPDGSPPIGGVTSTKGDDPSGPNGKRLSAADEAAYAELYASKPTAQQIEAFWQSKGFGGVMDAAKIARAAKRGVPFGGIDYGAMDKAAQAERDKALRGEVNAEKAAGRDSPVTALGGQGITLGLSDELKGIGGALRGLYNEEDPFNAYRHERDKERLRIEDARQQLGYAGTALEVGSSLLTAPIGAGGVAARGIGGLAKAGAKWGALSGFGYGEGLKGSAIGTVAGAAAGAGVAGALGWAAPKVAPLAQKLFERKPDPAIARAAIDENVRVGNLMVEGTPRDINRAARMEADPTTAPIIQQGFADTASDIGSGVERLAGGGSAVDTQVGGDMVKTAAARIKDQHRKATTAAYDAAQKVDGDPSVDLASMRANLDEELGRLRQTPNVNSDQIRFLDKIRRDIEQPLPLSQVRDMRSNLRDAVSSNDLGRTRAERRVLSAMEAAKGDIEKSLSPAARAEWQKADELYRDTRTFEAEALEPFVGKDFDKLSSEAVFQRIKSAASPKGNGRALASLHRKLSPDESRSLAATFAEGLGRAGPDEPFSTARFISHARNLSDSARKTIFGPSGADSFNNLLRLSRRLEKVKAQTNTSHTARPVINAIRQRANYMVLGLLGMGGAYGAGPMGAGAGLAAAGTLIAGSAGIRALSAKALMNPRTTAWLERAADVRTPKQAEDAVKRLALVISREPILASELQPLHDFLSRVVTPRLAASEPDSDNADDQQR